MEWISRTTFAEEKENRLTPAIMGPELMKHDAIAGRATALRSLKAEGAALTDKCRMLFGEDEHRARRFPPLGCRGSLQKHVQKGSQL